MRPPSYPASAATVFQREKRCKCLLGNAQQDLGRWSQGHRTRPSLVLDRAGRGEVGEEMELRAKTARVGLERSHRRRNFPRARVRMPP